MFMIIERSQSVHSIIGRGLFVQPGVLHEKTGREFEGGEENAIWGQ